MTSSSSWKNWERAFRISGKAHKLPQHVSYRFLFPYIYVPPSCSSFDEYSSELKSGRLEWSPVHKSEKFWRENAVRLNEKNYELLK